MNNPIPILKLWIEEERRKGAPYPQQAVLSTANQQGIPHARIIARAFS